MKNKKYKMNNRIQKSAIGLFKEFSNLEAILNDTWSTNSASPSAGKWYFLGSTCRESVSKLELNSLAERLWKDCEITEDVRLPESGRDYANTAGYGLNTEEMTVSRKVHSLRRDICENRRRSRYACVCACSWQRALFSVGTSGTLMRDSRWQNAIAGSLSALSLNNKWETRKKKKHWQHK